MLGGARRRMEKENRGVNCLPIDNTIITLWQMAGLQCWGRFRGRWEEECGQWVGKLKGTGHDQERKYLLCAYKAGCPRDLWQGIYFRFNRKPGRSDNGGEHLSGWLWGFLASPLSLFKSTTRQQLHVERRSREIVIFAPSHCKSVEREKL